MCLPPRRHVQQQPGDDADGQPGVAVLALLREERTVSPLPSVVSLRRGPLVVHLALVPADRLLQLAVPPLLRRRCLPSASRRPPSFLAVVLGLLLALHREDAVRQRKLLRLAVVCQGVWNSHVGGAHLLAEGGATCSASGVRLLPEELAVGGSRQEQPGPGRPDRNQGLDAPTEAQEVIEDGFLLLFLLLIDLHLPGLHLLLAHLPAHLGRCGNVSCTFYWFSLDIYMFVTL